MANSSLTSPERLLVGIGPSPSSVQIVRTVAKMAASSQAAWYAVYVESPRMLRLPVAERQCAAHNLQLAEQWGAETATLRGRSIGEELVNFARQRNITRIIAGKPTPRPRWRNLLSESPLPELLRLSGEIDVYVISGERTEGAESALPVQPKGLLWSGYEGGLLYFILATVLCFLMYPFFDLPNLIMVYLLAVMVTAVQCGRGPAILNSFLSVLAFDVCFVPPRWSLTVEDAKYIVTFVVMFLTALVISHLASLIKRQAEAARLQERQTAAMYSLSRQLAGTRGIDMILQVAVKQISEICACQAVALLPDEKGKLRPAAGDLSAVFQKDIVKELEVAQWAYEAGQIAGWGTQNRPDSPILYVPLPGTKAALGALALRPIDPEAENWLLPEQMRLRLLESLAKQVALAMEMEYLGAEMGISA